MKKKELKNLAKRIADAEFTLQNSTDSAAKAKAQDLILELSSKITSLDDIMTVDELVQEILSQKT